MNKLIATISKTAQAKNKMKKLIENQKGLMEIE